MGGPLGARIEVTIRFLLDYSLAGGDDAVLMAGIVLI